MRCLLVVLCMMIAHMSTAQFSVQSGILLRENLIEKINEYRVSEGLMPLEEDPILQKSALDHSKYMAKNNEFSHFQKGATKTPEKRVKKNGGDDFALIGENILVREVDNLKMNKKEIEALADSMVNQWKASPPHNANMLQPEYVFGDIAVTADPKTNRVYATQVFANKGQRVEGQLSTNSFGIRNSVKDCDGVFKTHQNLISNVGNSIYLENDTFFLYYHDVSLVEEIFTGAKDGIAVDVIDRTQLDCGGPNLLDMSKIYDGILLEPVYRNDLLGNNRAKGEHRIITPIGVLPESLKGKDVQPAIIYIKDNQKCRYEVPAYVPHEPYTMQPYEPQLINPDVSLKNSGIRYSEELHFDFETSITTSTSTPVMQYKEYEVHSVSIASYSSIEGSEANNITLHKSRGKFIENYIAARTKSKNYPVQIDATENWRMFDFQLRYNFADSLLDKSRDELRKFVVSGDSTLDWSSLLADQRSSTAYVNYYGTLVNPTEIERITLNLKTAIAEKNYPLANKALYEYYSNVETEGFDLLFDGQVFEALLNQKELVQNAAAALSLVYPLDPLKTTLFIHSWANRLDELSNEARNNVLNLYSLTGYDLVVAWDVSAQKLANVIHPKRLEALINESLPVEIAINSNLTFLYFYGHTLEQEGLTKAFEFVRSFVEKRELGQADIQKLALFFNDWSRYDLTRRMLYREYEHGTISNQNLKILAHTIARYNDGSEEFEKYYDVMIALQKAEPEYWCNWLDLEFQVLRNHELKYLFCENCK